ncbi:MAG: formylglycine-generating enzyme family protein [Bacteroidetes bacterium]|nr:formylglycine-generating enzyme family protein [Bacteroidota bacterium]
MKKLFPLLFFFFMMSIGFTQAAPDENETHGKAAKHNASKPEIIEPKVAEAIRLIEMNMVPVEGGTFTMGCVLLQDPECYEQEKPRHTVKLNNFQMSKYAVTQNEWKLVMGTTPAAEYCAECPAINVSWYDAQLFINRLNQLSGKTFRLPSEAEWEYAAKGGSKSHGYKYAGSNDADVVAWYDTLKTNGIKPVGKKAPNELGLYDMSGNVWQWCTDYFDEKYYSHSPSNNPKGPDSSDARSLRGGSWWGPLRDCRVANRDFYPADSKDDDVGFRMVLD